MRESTELLRQLVAINSINPDLVVDGPGEGEIARFVAAWLTDAGLEIHLDEPEAGRPNVVGIARGSGGGSSLLLNAHMDTVGVALMERPHEPVIEGKRLYGSGSLRYEGRAGCYHDRRCAGKKPELARRCDSYSGIGRGVR